MASSTVAGRKRARYEREGRIEMPGETPIDKAFNGLIADVKRPTFRIRLWLRMKWRVKVRRQQPLVVVPPGTPKMPLLTIRVLWPRHKKLQQDFAKLRQDMYDLQARMLDLENKRARRL